MTFLERWGDAAYTTAGFFWMALWAFCLGYLVSSGIQVFVTRERMRRSMGEAGARSVALATFFGFISSSCSFAALATTKSLFKKGAGLIPSLAFLLASTNLVIELGIVIAVFLSWHFIVGEYVGGILLILFAWLFVKVTRPWTLVEDVRERLRDDEEGAGGAGEVPDWREKVRSRKGWGEVAETYFGEWRMVWKDVTVGFTIAGVVAAFVPREVFEWLFLGTAEGGREGATPFLHVLEHTLVGPVAAFLTFIGSMGNIPLAGVLYSRGVSVAGIMAFLFSDLVVFPVLRIHARYYGWKMALYILAALLVALVLTSLLLHYGFELAGLSPEASHGKDVTDQRYFKVNYTLVLNGIFLAMTAGLAWLGYTHRRKRGGHDMASQGWVERLLFVLAMLAAVWLVVGLILRFATG
jgi:hypothetical protein